MRIELFAFVVAVVFVIGVDNAVVNVVDIVCVLWNYNEEERKRREKCVQIHNT